MVADCRMSELHIAKTLQVTLLTVLLTGCVLLLCWFSSTKDGGVHSERGGNEQVKIVSETLPTGQDSTRGLAQLGLEESFTSKETISAQVLRQKGYSSCLHNFAADALWDAAEETRTIVAVAAFRALADMAEFDPHIDASRLDSRLAACVTDASASPAVRVMAAQLCGERRVASQQPFGLVHEGNGWGFFGCGASSGGESGDGAMADVGLSCMVSGVAVAACGDQALASPP